jgi:ADP-ribosylglycohydrolase
VYAVNDSRDNDTVGAIVGGAVGALQGWATLPQNWIDGRLGRTTADADRLFEVIVLAQRWG